MTTKFKVVSGKYIETKNSLSAAKLYLKGGKVEKHESVKLRPGKLFVLGVGERDQVATLGTAPKHEGVVYNVTLSDLAKAMTEAGKKCPKCKLLMSAYESKAGKMLYSCEECGYTETMGVAGGMAGTTTQATREALKPTKARTVSEARTLDEAIEAGADVVGMLRKDTAAARKNSLFGQLSDSAIDKSISDTYEAMRVGNVTGPRAEGNDSDTSRAFTKSIRTQSGSFGLEEDGSIAGGGAATTTNDNPSLSSANSALTAAGFAPISQEMLDQIIAYAAKGLESKYIFKRVGLPWPAINIILGRKGDF